MYDHAEFASNWDKVDAIFGGPESGVWPSGGIYDEVKRASDGAIPLGLMFPWFRPSLVVPIPPGYVVADGTTLTPSQHSFPGGGNVTIPDLRNRFVLGADYTKEIGEAPADVESPLALTSDGAPGPNATGGSNAVSVTTTQLPKHTHTGGYTGWSPAIMTWYYQSSTYEAQKVAPQILDNRDEAIARCGKPGCYHDPERTAPIYPRSENFNVVTWSKGAQYSSGDGGFIIGQHRHSFSSLSSSGSNAVHENRPRYIGLIWLIKVLNG